MQTIDLAFNIFSLPVCKDDQKQLSSALCGGVPCNTKGVSSATTSPVGDKESRRSSAAFPAKTAAARTYVSVVPCFTSVVICSPAYLVSCFMKKGKG